MKQIFLTYKGIINSLPVNNRVRLALENASIHDLENLKRSIQEEIRNKKAGKQSESK